MLNKNSTRKQPLADLAAYIPLSLLSVEQAVELVDTIVADLDERWSRWGNCVGKNPDYFCATGYVSEQTPKPAAADICAMCPVRAQCARQALNNLDDHAWTVMGGVSLPFNPRKSHRAQRQLEVACEEDPYVRRKVAWHMVMSLYALRAKKCDTAAAWALVRRKVDWGVFVRTCSKVGVIAPRDPRVPAIMVEEPVESEE